MVRRVLLRSVCVYIPRLSPAARALHISTSDQTNALNVLSVSSSLTSQTQPITQPLGKKTSPRSNPAFACMHLLSLSPPVPLTSSCYTYFCTLRDSTSAWHVKHGWNTAHEGKDKWEMCKHWGGGGGGARMDLGNSRTLSEGENLTEMTKRCWGNEKHIVRWIWFSQTEQLFKQNCCILK